MAEEYEVADENPISKMVDYISHSEYQKANEIFNELLGQRVSDSLDQEKIAVAQSIYSDDEEYTEEELEDALEDEEEEEDEESFEDDE